MCRVKHIKELKECNDIYIGRGSKWGNPFKIGEHGNREQVIKLYEEYLNNSDLLRDLKQLKGKNLVCFCSPKPCHGDILLRKLGEAQASPKPKLQVFYVINRLISGRYKANPYQEGKHHFCETWRVAEVANKENYEHK